MPSTFPDSLFDCGPGPYARRDHPDTSYGARDAIAPIKGKLQRKVYDFLRSRGSDGATDLEVQAALAMNESTERPRRVELVEKGLVLDSGRRRKTPSHRPAIVWIVNEHVCPA